MGRVHFIFREVRDVVSPGYSTPVLLGNDRFCFGKSLPLNIVPVVAFEGKFHPAFVQDIIQGKGRFGSQASPASYFVQGIQGFGIGCSRSRTQGRFRIDQQDIGIAQQHHVVA